MARFFDTCPFPMGRVQAWDRDRYLTVAAPGCKGKGHLTSLFPEEFQSAPTIPLQMGSSGAFFVLGSNLA